MVVDVSAEDIKPGISVRIYTQFAGFKPRWEVVKVESVKLAIWHGRYRVQLNGSDYKMLDPDEEIEVVPDAPTSRQFYDPDVGAWRICIESQGDVVVEVNGRELSDGVIHVDSERIKELE
jgi:hypothetical protein